jgi:peptidoglycan/LPS O-acetylase OafA/YrhL
MVDRLEARFPALDGLRGLAAAWVILHHLAAPLTEGDGLIARVLYWPQVLGWAGVDLFFVLSGFLITGILTAERNAPNYFVAFYAHRALRIWPALILLFVIVLAVLPNLGLVELNRPIWPYLVFLSNLGLVLPVGEVKYLGVTWSLAIEEQFYIAWSLLVFLLSTRSLAIVAGVTLFAGLALRCALTGAHPDNQVFLFTLTHLDGLCVGALLRLAYDSARWRPALSWFGKTAWLWLACYAIGIALDIYVWPQGDIGVWAYQFNMRFGLTLLALLFGAVCAAGMMNDGFVRVIFDMSWLRRLGEYSYFMYLFHFLLVAPVLAVADRLGVQKQGAAGLGLLCIEFAVVIGVAHLSSKYFEQPIRRLKRFIPYQTPLRPRHNKAAVNLPSPT